MTSPIAELRERFAAFGQDHVFRFWSELDEAARERLVRQARGIDVGALAAVHQQLQRPQSADEAEFEPPPVERLPGCGGSAEHRAQAAERGLEALRAGRVGFLVVAGGQGTRLGFEGPKGSFPLGPVGERSLFEIHAQRIGRACARAGRALPWYVMTSPATDAPTREFFAKHDHFGLEPAQVTCFCQGTAPALDFDGKLLLEARDRIAINPNGHGGVFRALADAGAFEALRAQGIDTLSYFQVDNPLVPVADPVMLGAHAELSAQMSCKVIRKRGPIEKIGVFAQRGGRIGVIEYTEIAEPQRSARDDAGELVFWAGSPAIHALDVEFAAEVAERADELLPHHASAKKIPHIDAQGRPVRPSEPNGHKLERFLFDALPAADRVLLLEIEREREYAPVKNADGPDSPAGARAALESLYRAWLREAGVAVADGVALELDHRQIDSVEDIRMLGVRSLDHPAIRTAGGTA